MVGISHPPSADESQIQSDRTCLLEEGTQVFNLDLNKGATAEATFFFPCWGWGCNGWYPNCFGDGRPGFYKDTVY